MDASAMNNSVGFIFRSACKRFCSSTCVFSTFECDAISFINCIAKILINGFNGFWTLLLSLIFEIPRSKSMLKLMQLLCRFEFGNASVEIYVFSGLRMFLAVLFFFRCFPEFRSVRILDSIVRSGLLGWLFSPAWDAVKLACRRLSDPDH